MCSGCVWIFKPFVVLQRYSPDIITEYKKILFYYRKTYSPPPSPHVGSPGNISICRILATVLGKSVNRDTDISYFRSFHCCARVSS